MLRTTYKVNTKNRPVISWNKETVKTALYIIRKKHCRSVVVLTYSRTKNKSKLVWLVNLRKYLAWLNADIIITTLNITSAWTNTTGLTSHVTSARNTPSTRRARKTFRTKIRAESSETKFLTFSICKKICLSICQPRCSVGQLILNTFKDSFGEDIGAYFMNLEMLC